jgi:hypothetical protein
VRTERNKHKANHHQGVNFQPLPRGQYSGVVDRCVSDNRRLADACHWWAFAALTKSPAPEHTRAAGDTYNAALRNLANKLIAKLFYCLQNNTPYAESSAWSTPNDADVKTSLLDR